MRTFEQKMAEKAFERAHSQTSEEYRSFALSFPSLIHTCGLVQAIAFAESKKMTDYLEDLAEVLKTVEKNLGQNLSKVSRETGVVEYMRLSRRSLSAASWLKRYVPPKEGEEGC
ncbi:hypothetical protein FACS1894167_05080 [Synergistales bacterium]|nr:hypothetical protein FACS1894167_05080 [Synergistales bacterium]